MKVCHVCGEKCKVCGNCLCKLVHRHCKVCYIGRCTPIGGECGTIIKGREYYCEACDTYECEAHTRKCDRCFKHSCYEAACAICGGHLCGTTSLVINCDDEYDRNYLPSLGDRRCNMCAVTHPVEK